MTQTRLEVQYRKYILGLVIEHNVCTFHIWHLDVVVEHVVGPGLGRPVSRAHRGVQLGVVVADPLQSARAKSVQMDVVI